MNGDGSADNALDNPILNSPYEPPAAHFVLGPGGPTGEVQAGRRRSESFIAVPTGRRNNGADAQQQGLDFDATGERREVNTFINDIRQRVELWRARGYTGVTPITRKLLLHWADPQRENRVLFCQREAAESAGSSTLRRTLAGLLTAALDLHAVPRNLAKPGYFSNFGLTPDGDARLTTWMVANLRLSVWVPDSPVTLDDVETEVLKRLEPPLNLSKIKTPWSSQVSVGRAELAAEARRWRTTDGEAVEDGRE